MATYTNSGGLTKPATGEFSGTWGTITNTNFDILDRLVNGVASIPLTSTPYALATSDGALSVGQYLLINFTGSLGGTVTVNVTPQDATKIYFIRNSSNSSLVISQGSGSTVTIASGYSKLVYTDGAGSTASVFDFTSVLSMSGVQITGGTITGITDLAVADGGTGASDAATARANLGFTGAVTTIAATDLTASRALASDASGKVAVSATTSAELGFVSGVTSAIQTQMNTKAPSASPTLSGTITISGGTQAWTVIASGTNLTFAYNGVNKMRVDSSGNITVTGNVTAFGTIA
jgi:hypothetical protein